MSYPINPRDQRQLFLDDRAIEGCRNVRRRLHRPAIHGPIIEPQGEQVSVQSRSIPYFNPDKGHWEWWYWANHPCEPYGPWHSTAVAYTHYAVSDDGFEWDLPELGLHALNGSTANNIAMDPALGERALYHILCDPRDVDPAQRYKAMMGHHNRAPHVSANGFDWTAVDTPSVQSSDESHLTWDPQTQRFIATVKIGTEWGRSVWLSTSEEFLSWTAPELILHTDPEDCNNRIKRVREAVDDPTLVSPPLVDDGDYMAELYQMAVLPYEGLYVGFPLLFNPAGAIPPPQMNHTGLNQVELAVSHDLRSWERVAGRERFLAIEPWDGNAYGTAQVALCGTPIVTNDEILIYYNALRFRGHQELYPKKYHPYFNRISALNLARLRRDGFVSLAATGNGSVVTKPFAYQGEAIHINANAEGGELRAELLDGVTLKPIEGYTADRSAVVTTDTLDTALTWSEGAKAHPGSVRLRVALCDAELYSFWLESRSGSVDPSSNRPRR